MHALRYNPAETFGPKKPLFGPYTYRVKQNSNGDTLIAVYHGSKRIAHMDAFWAYSMRNIEEHEEEQVRGKRKRLVCATDLRALGAEGKHPNVLSVSHAFIDDPDYKGKGIGRAMYQAMMVEGFAVRESRIGGSRGPMFFIPDECKGAGNTSADAQRVWASLAREYPSAGTSIRVDAPPVIGSRPAAAPAPVPVASPAPKARPMNTSHMYDDLHAAAGPELRAWMDAHHAAVERVDRYREALDNAADSIYGNVADSLKTDPTYFSSPEEAVRAHGGIAEELWGERLDRADLALYPFSQAWPFIYALALEAVPYAFENMRRGMRGAAPVREYRYGVRNRPPGYATVPSGYIRVDPPPFQHEPRVRHGIVVYNRPLTNEEVRSYELHPYKPLAEIVDEVIASFGEYAEIAYAPNVREEGAEQVRQETGYILDEEPKYFTDVPLAEVYKHVAKELLRRFPETAPEPVSTGGSAPTSRAEDLRVAWEDLSPSEMDERLATWVPVLKMAASDKEERDSEASEIPMMLSALGFDEPEKPLADWEVSRLLNLLGVGETTRKKVSKALAVKIGSPGPKWQRVFDVLDESRSASRADREAQETRRKLLERVRTELPSEWGMITHWRQTAEKHARAVRSDHAENKRRRERGERVIPESTILFSIRDRQNAEARAYEAEEAAIRALTRRNPRRR